MRPLKELYGHTPVGDFDSLGLEAVRRRMIENGLCRNRINQDAARIKRLFKWAASKKLVPLAAYQNLQTVEGLRAGRSAATETDPVKPVPVPFRRGYAATPAPPGGRSGAAATADGHAAGRSADNGA